MANEELVALLRQGHEVWNSWRSKNSALEIDFRGVDLSNIDLSMTNLIEADLRNANLIDTDFFKSTLFEANLIEADLRNADLIDADLSSATLSEANLSHADLIEANLSHADLIEANLSHANLQGANLWGTNLQRADLRNASLFAARVLKADFTEAILTGACIADWQIGSSTNLEGVKCDYIFLAKDSDGKFVERRPANPDKIFESGEFTKLFQVLQDTVELIFQQGMNWEAFAYSFSETNTKVFDASGEELYLRKYEVLGDGLIRLEVTVPPGSDKQVIHDDLERGYEQKIARLEGEVKAKSEVLNQVLRMLKPGDIYMNSSNNEISQTFNAPVGNVAGTNQGKMQNIQHIYAPEQKDLSAAAREIQALLNTLAETYNTTTETGQEKLMKELGQEVEKHPKWRRALKEGGIELIKVLCAPIGVPLEMARVYLEED